MVSFILELPQKGMLSLNFVFIVWLLFGSDFQRSTEISWVVFVRCAGFGSFHL